MTTVKYGLTVVSSGKVNEAAGIEMKTTQEFVGHVALVSLSEEGDEAGRRWLANPAVIGSPGLRTNSGDQISLGGLKVVRSLVLSEPTKVRSGESVIVFMFELAKIQADTEHQIDLPQHLSELPAISKKLGEKRVLVVGSLTYFK